VRVARSIIRFVCLPALTLVVSCATAVEQGFDGEEPGGGGSLSNQSGSTNTGGQVSAAGKSTGGGGKTTGAFGGTSSSSGTGGTAGAGQGGNAGTSSAGSSGSDSGGTDTGGSGGTGTGGGGMAGKSSGGSGGSGGKASGGSGGSSAGTSGSGGSSGGSGSGGSGGSTGSTGECAPAGTGWVVQYWTNTPPANMPAGDLRVFNNNGGTVNFTTLELRHYFTNEETATMTFTFSTFGHNFPGMPYYEDENGANVQSSIVAVTPAATNASSYIRIRFNATPGNFGNNEWVQLGFYGSLSMYPLKSNQANDYTYIGHPTSDPGSANKNTGWDHITLYQDGELVWGCEP
jgi:hypothetical protein